MSIAFYCTLAECQWHQLHAAEPIFSKLNFPLLNNHTVRAYLWEQISLLLFEKGDLWLSVNVRDPLNWQYINQMGHLFH